MASQSPTAIDRRALITGSLPVNDRVTPPPGAEIASILVQAKPERLADVEQAVIAVTGCEIYGRDSKGKLIVIAEAADSGALGSILNTIAALPNVYSACLVFHAIDTG
jgi:nitrate reductase NapD